MRNHVARNEIPTEDNAETAYVTVERISLLKIMSLTLSQNSHRDLLRKKFRADNLQKHATFYWIVRLTIAVWIVEPPIAVTVTE